MNRIFYSLLLFAAVCINMAACSSGTYDANPASNANGSINPLNPLKANQFSWGAAPVGQISFNLNGSSWSSDTAYLFWVDSLQTNVVYGINGKSIIVLYLSNVWGGNIYPMGFKEYSQLGEYLDSLYEPSIGWYQSALGNSGELYMTANDTLNFDGKFYFQAVNGSGGIDNITNGTFTLNKY